MSKRMISLLLAIALCLGLCACGTADKEQTTAGTEAPATTAETAGNDQVDKSSMDYDELSAYVYNQALGEFLDTYEAASAAETVSQRYALMAVAEAKLLESGVLMPTYSAGGQYAISRVAPYTVAYTLWGTDYERYHQALVCTELLSTDVYTAMKAK